MQRELDIVLLGATGYTGRLCAEWIGNVLSSEVKLAIAGRSKDKLTALAESLDRDGNSDPQADELQFEGIVLDVSSEGEVASLVRRTKVVMSVAGRYADWESHSRRVLRTERTMLAGEDAQKTSRVADRTAMATPLAPGYNAFTGQSLAEAAMVLINEGTKAHRRGGGILTPAMLGEVFAGRLTAAGVKIDVKALQRLP